MLEKLLDAADHTLTVQHVILSHKVVHDCDMHLRWPVNYCHRPHFQPCRIIYDESLNASQLWTSSANIHRSIFPPKSPRTGLDTHFVHMPARRWLASSSPLSLPSPVALVRSSAAPDAFSVSPSFARAASFLRAELVPQGLESGPVFW